MNNKPIFIGKKSCDSVIAELPKHEKLDINTLNKEIDDILIVVNGFEDRANALVNDLSKTDYKAKKVFIGKYKTNEKDNRKNLQEMIDSIKKITQNYEFLDADEPNLINSILRKYIENITMNDTIKISIDISATSDRFILFLMQIIMDLEKEISLRIIYFEAESYSPSYEEYNKDKEKCINNILESNTTHEKGIGEIFTSPFHVGCNTEEQYSSYLIAIPTLKLNRILKMLTNYDSNFFNDRSGDSVFWILGKPEEHTWREELQNKVLLKGLKQYQMDDSLISEHNKVSCSTLDYSEIMKIIIQKIDENPRKKFTIIPMGSKMQTIGVSFALFLRYECSVLLARPEKFNPKSYSKGIGKKWCILFENTKTLKKNLKNINCFVHKPPENIKYDVIMNT